MEAKPTNDGESAVTKFCHALEELRRTDAGRVKSAKELVDHFFPHDASKATDLLFVHLPREVRAPVVAGWGIRGAKAALRDDDPRIRDVVHDALLAGDIDETSFEEGVTASLLVHWVPLGEWWRFWRSGKVAGTPTQRALAVARELALFDDRWFLENLESRGGRHKGTDTLCDTLTKDQIVAWVRGIHASGDGSPAGLVAALGWETILAKTSQEALLFVLDALAKKIGLVAAAAAAAPEVPAVLAASAAAPAVPAASAAAPADDAPWPEIASPGDMGYALAKPEMGSVRPAYGAGDDEVTSEHQIPVLAGAPKPPALPNE